MKYLLSTTFLYSILLPSLANADPVSIAIGTAASLGGAVATGALVASEITALVVMKHLAFATAMSFVRSSLQPKPPSLGGLQIAGGTRQAGYNVSGLSAIGDQAIIYGKTKVGGVVVFKEATDNNKFLHIIVALAGHQCQEIETVFLNDESLTLNASGFATAPSKYANKVRIKKAIGTDSQQADADLVAESDGKWTTDHRLQGICYVYARLEFDADAFPNGEPTITAIVKGKQVLNANTQATEWTQNSAYILRDYLTSSYGLGVDATEIDDTLFVAAANICDENVSLSAGGTEKRYTTNGSFTTGSKPKDVIDALTRAMGGTIWYAQGKWRVRAAAYVTPALTFTEDDLLAGFTISTRHSRRDNYNIVRGTFVGSETNYQQSDFPQIKSQTFINADNGIESAIDLDLGFTDTNTRAQRIAKIALFKNREQLTIEGTFSIKAMQAQIGDIVQITNTRLGFSNKTFEVTNWRMDFDEQVGFKVHMILREISSTVYDWDAEEATFETNNTTLPDPFDVPTLGVSLSSEARIINEHLTNVIIVNTSSSNPERVDNVEVQFKKNADATFVSAGIGDIGNFEIIDVTDDDYDVRVRAINTFGIKGSFQTISNFSVTGLSAPPADVTGFNFDVAQAGIHLQWEPVADLDLSFYQIRHSKEETGATFANATNAVSKVARPGNSVTVAPRSGTYLIKAYDKSGNQSESAASVVVRANDILGYANTNNQSEHTSFSGNKTGCSVDSGQRLIITDPSSQPSTATYEFSQVIDTGSVRTARVEMLVNSVRIDNSAATFDTFTGDFDSLGGLFDDLSGGSSFADTDVIAFVATTDDDPSGSPTFSAFKQFKASDFSGRAFKFKVELKSTGDNITPAISELTARVRYD